MKATLLCFLVVFLFGVLVTSKSQEKVKIAVYYESLCPDSKMFITKQLAPVWRELRGAVKVKLVPYGKSTHDNVDGNWRFECHHGPDECKGNKIQACVLKDDKLQDTEKMEVIICLMGQASPDKSLSVCLNQAKLSSKYDRLRKCAEGQQGDKLLASYGDKTAKVKKPLSFVPTIVINEIFDQQLQDDAFKDLKGVICRVAKDKPSQCE